MRIRNQKNQTKSRKQMKKEQDTQTNKQAIKQVSKRTNDGTKKTNKQCRLFFFWSDAMAGAIACGQTKQIKNNKQGNKQAIKQISKRANEETTKTNKPSRLFFFWSDAMVGAIACGQTKQIKNNKQAIT